MYFGVQSVFESSEMFHACLAVTCLKRHLIGWFLMLFAVFQLLKGISNAVVPQLTCHRRLGFSLEHWERTFFSGCHLTDFDKYTRSIRACALEEYIERFPDKDLVIVGERGDKLSGGQQIRISLARAVYADCVSNHIFKHCIPAKFAWWFLTTRVTYETCRSSDCLAQWHRNW